MPGRTGWCGIARRLRSRRLRFRTETSGWCCGKIEKPMLQLLEPYRFRVINVVSKITTYKAPRIVAAGSEQPARRRRYDLSRCRRSCARKLRMKRQYGEGVRSEGLAERRAGAGK